MLVSRQTPFVNRLIPGRQIYDLDHQISQGSKIDPIVIFAILLFGSFNDLGNTHKFRIIHDKFKRLQPDMSLPDVLVAVHPGIQLFFGIV